MSKRYSVESPNQPSSTPIKPALQGALGCLDVNLEAELTKYRKHRRRSEQWVSPSLRPGKPTSTPDRPPGQNLPTASQEVQQPLPLTLAGVPGDAPIIAATKVSKPQKLSASASGPDSYLESSEKLIESLDEQTVETVEERSLAASLLTPLGLSSMLLFLLSCTALGYAVMHPSSLVKIAGLNRWLPNDPSTAESPASTPADTASKELPEINLASKEQAFDKLDRSTLSLVNPTASPIPTPSPAASIPPTPTAISNPTGLVHIPAGDGNPPRGSEQGMNNISTALLPSPSPTATQPVPTLPTLPPTPSPLPLASASPAAPPPATAPATSPAALGTPTRASDGFYYVVTDYTDEKSLAAARNAVPDAYVRNFSKGVKIQMGAVNDAASAERLVKELQAKGVRAQYDRP
ncbi:MAG: SPOR domain-containing protein [Oscillatoriaceae cyanobacterium Prado104]|jgi:hypothetical protein|nr:SPOR domain-containing protein [Oscillatoriaceae cyanobacterium Prado104]